MITLQQQIMLTEGRIKAREQRDSDAPLDDAILASLRRLQTIEAQEPVAIFTYNPDETPCMNQVWKTEFYKGTVNLYALPVSTEVLHIPYADEWKKNVMRLWACARKRDSDIPDAQLDFMRDYLLAAGEVRHD